MNPLHLNSHERFAHDSGVPCILLDLRPGVHDGLRGELAKPRLERFIGILYRPDTERWSHYVECELPAQFDAPVWFDELKAVVPLATEPQAGPDDTYPFGL